MVVEENECHALRKLLQLLFCAETWYCWEVEVKACSAGIQIRSNIWADSSCEILFDNVMQSTLPSLPPCFFSLSINLCLLFSSWIVTFSFLFLTMSHYNPPSLLLCHDR